MNEAKSSLDRPPSARLFYQDTPVPGAKKSWNNNNDTHNDDTTPHGDGATSNASLGSRDSSYDTVRSLPATSVSIETTTDLLAEQARKEESGVKKIRTRIIYGACMLVGFSGMVSEFLCHAFLSREV
jgi:hypothetical protein